MEDKDYDEIRELFPTLVPLESSLRTWKGFLTVFDRDKKYDLKVKIKLIVPYFPRLDSLKVYFGNNIASAFGTNFTNQIESLIKESEVLTKFLQDLIILIENSICSNQNNDTFSNPADMHEVSTKLLKELKYVLSEYSDAEISSTKDLSKLKLTMNDISLIVKPSITSTGQNTWNVISSDLPQLPGFPVNDKKSVTLKEIRTLFQKQVDTLEEVWDQLRRIDNFCYVTDPIDPKPYHLYRRIYLSPTLSFLLTLNPLDPVGYPKIKFLGTKKEVDKYVDIIQDENAVENWDLECSVYENLLTLLNLDEFPTETRKEDQDAEEAMVGDKECCICFSLETEGGDITDEICNNYRCRRHFHSICLFQWLQELVTNKIVFNTIVGPCPNCGDEISCTVPTGT